jgi:aspartate/methionine/tyrosine aminotransferase
MQIEPFKLERYFAKYEFSTEYLLCSSDCQSMSIGELLSLEPGAEEAFAAQWLGYTESTGGPELRRAISAIYDSIEPDNVLVHTGAEEAIYLFMHAMLEPGDHIIVHWPCYQSLAAVARSIGCEVSLWKAREENGWNPGIEALEALLRPNTKAIIVNTPHNPTGFLMPRAEFEAVSAIAREAGALLFSDEVYRELEYEPGTRLPAACDLGEHAVSLGVMSKTYGLAGLRIGWIATQNHDIYDRMAALKDYTTICNSAPSEFLAALALRHRGQLAGRNLDIIQRNLGVIEDLFARHPDQFRWVAPRAGSMGFPRYIGGSVDAFCDTLVRRAGVLLLPGSIYDDHGNHFRLGLGRLNLPEAANRLEEYLLSGD